MSKHKAIPKKTRLKSYDKYNHRCAYCGCDLEYKDMQVDHVKSVYTNLDLRETMTEKEMYVIKSRYKNDLTCMMKKTLCQLADNAIFTNPL